MKIRKLVTGSLMTNCYILGETSVALVDPGSNGKGIYEYIKKEGLTLSAILVTHGHFDHVGALGELKELTGAKVYMHRDDICMLGDMEKSLGFMTNTAPPICEVDYVLSGGEKLEFDFGTIRVMHTPGHSQGSVCYIGDDFVASGDLIFKGSIGRYDYGSYTDEIESIHRLLNEIPDDTVLLPGHGEETTAEYEKNHNPYVRQNRN